MASTSLAPVEALIDLVAPLACGGTVVIAASLHEWLAARPECPIDLMRTTPSLLRRSLEGMPAGNMPVTLLMAGNALPSDLNRLSRERGTRSLVRLCESAEAGVFFAAEEAVASAGPGLTGLSATVSLRDDQFGLVPAMVPGELCLGGAALASGYLGAPALTAERLVPDPDGPPGSRLFRTGLIARRRAGGALEILGPRDSLLTALGMRTGVAEIERLLVRYPGVDEACVVSSPSLAAAIVGRDELSLVALRAWLARRLPRRLIPKPIVSLAALPRSISGTADRAATAAAIGTLGDASVDAPSDNSIPELSSLWEELLGRGTARTDVDFFGCGGDSLLATRLLAEVRKRFGVQLTLADFLDTPELGALSRRVALARWANAAAPFSVLEEGEL